MRTEELDALAAELDEVREERDRLMAILAPSLDAMRADGSGLAADVLQFVRKYRHRYLEIGCRLNADPALLASAGAASLNEWGVALQKRKRERRLAAAFDALKRLQVCGRDAPGPLAGVQEDVDRIQGRISDGDDSLADELLEGRHPLSAVLQLVAEAEQLTDEAWTELQDRVSASYGRELSTAIARGRITIREELSPMEAEVSP
jgi:hypothetical protein